MIRRLSRIRIAHGRATASSSVTARGAHEDHGVALELARALGSSAMEAVALERLGWTTYSRVTFTWRTTLPPRPTSWPRTQPAQRDVGPGGLLLAGRMRHWHGDVDGAEHPRVAETLRDMGRATTKTAGVVPARLRPGPSPCIRDDATAISRVSLSECTDAGCSGRCLARCSSTPSPAAGGDLGGRYAPVRAQA